MKKDKKIDDDIEIIDEEQSSFKKKTKGSIEGELDEVKKERKEYLEGWQRAKADFANLKKEVAEEKVRFAKYAVEDLITQLLPVLDSFDMAFKNKEAWEKQDANWRSGIEYIYNQFVSVLKDNGVVQMNPLNEKFDPTKHDSVKTISVDSKEQESIILDVISKGYALHDKIIRAPKVVVGHYQN